MSLKYMRVLYARRVVACGVMISMCMLICSFSSLRQLSDISSVEVSIALPLINFVFGREDDLLGISSVCLDKLSGGRCPLERADNMYATPRFYAVNLWI